MPVSFHRIWADPQSQSCTRWSPSCSEVAVTVAPMSAGLRGWAGMGLVFQKCCAGVRGPPGAEIPLLGDAEDTWLSAVHRQRAPQDPRAWGPLTHLPLPPPSVLAFLKSVKLANVFTAYVQCTGEAIRKFTGHQIVTREKVSIIFFPQIVCNNE